MSNIKTVLIVKQSALTETMAELGDVLAGESVVIKIEKDYVFNSMFDIDTEKVDIDIDDDTLFTLMKTAHEKNITLNQYITEILTYQIEKMNKEDFVVENKKRLFTPKAETSFSTKENLNSLVNDLLAKT